MRSLAQGDSAGHEPRTWISAVMYSSSQHLRVSINSALKRPNQFFARPPNSFCTPGHGKTAWRECMDGCTRTHEHISPLLARTSQRPLHTQATDEIPAHTTEQPRVWHRASLQAQPRLADEKVWRQPRLTNERVSLQTSPLACKTRLPCRLALSDKTEALRAGVRGSCAGKPCVRDQELRLRRHEIRRCVAVGEGYGDRMGGWHEGCGGSDRSNVRQAEVRVESREILV